ncbi:uncharacterized protein LOC111374248 [Olea europaea var. sylvestris]|uniref:uncharacterized protein LOC111374248 n=1 Tax=Olea europaea var. sylvestris TaxID=158386 RepID=UPI000C1CF6E1|nr:uncharacterized protein LOC111374248 [Olea europaea var. sylvestris]
MDDSVAKVQSSAASGRSATRLLRYPLRSATKSKEEKPPLVDSSNSSAHERGKLASSVSKSVGVLDLSDKKAAAKPPRRLSVPSKPTASPAPRTIGNITPISETRAKRSAGKHDKSSDTPVSDVSKSSSRKKFSVLSSASYWLSQIKLSESAAKHSISLGFFKLALEAGCEPVQRMREELKSYVHCHNLCELGEPLKELFDSYEISEKFDQSNVSDTGSQMPGEGNNSSDGDVSSSSVTDSEKPKPKLKALDIDADVDCQIKKPNKETSQMNDSVKRSRRSVHKNVTSAKSPSEVQNRSTQKKPQKPLKQDVAKKGKVMKQGKKSAPGEGPLSTPPEESLQENKENMAASQMEEIESTDV